MTKKQSILDAFSVILVLFVNYYSQTGNINNQTVGALSNEYDNLFTPAGYAFAIWGIIFLALLAYAIYGLVVAFSAKEQSHNQTDYWFMLVNLGNVSWLIAWLYEYTGLSVVIMLFMLFGLVKIIISSNMGKAETTLSVRAFVWWPIAIYAGWISVATIANFAAYFSKLQWDGGFIGEETWTVAMIVIAVAVNVFVVWNRSLVSFGLVGIWALMAINSRHNGSMDTLALTALIGAGVILFNITLHTIRNLLITK